MEAATLTSSLVEEIAGVVGGSQNLPLDIETKLRSEGLSRESFILLNEMDLKELGFGMGPRKLVLQWIRKELPSDPSPTSDPSSQALTSAASSMPQDSHSNVNRKMFKGCQAAEVLSQYRKGDIDGRELAARLGSGGRYTPKERKLLVKIAGRHLMNNCKIQDRPHKEEKMAMVKSIIDAFPVLRDEMFYDATSHTGHLEAYIRCRRSRNPFIKTLWTNSRKAGCSHEVPMAIPADEEAERILREMRPNANNRAQLLQGMKDTRETRRSWIKEKHPTITDILRRYPRLQDMEDAVRDEFVTSNSVTKSLTAEFQAVKEKIITMAALSASTRDLLEKISDDYDEDKKSEVAFYCLAVMLRPPPKRGVRKPLPSASKLLGSLYRSFEDETVDGALLRLAEDGIHQPTLFKVHNIYYVKLDNGAVAVDSASCFSEAMEFAFMCFWVFDVAYPDELRLFYTFLEKLLGMCRGASEAKSRLLADVWRSLQNV